MGRARVIHGTVIMSLFSNVLDAPPIEVLEMKRKHDEDESPVKINLTVGGYKDEKGRPYVLPVVRQVEEELLAEQDHHHEYLPALGHLPACEAAIRLLLGED